MGFFGRVYQRETQKWTNYLSCEGVKLIKIQTFNRWDWKVAEWRTSQKQEKVDLSCMKIKTTIKKANDFNISKNCISKIKREREKDAWDPQKYNPKKAKGKSPWKES